MTASVTRVLVMIPAFNEGPRIGDVVRSVVSTFPTCDVLVVDDCSADDTGLQARQAGAKVIRHPVNLGYGAGLETGYLYALLHDYGAVIQMDGDGQHLPSEVSKILGPVLAGKADLAIGSRYLAGDGRYETSFARRFGHRFFCTLFRVITRTRITDPTSGFQCLNKKCLELFTSGGFPEDYPDTDVLLMAFFAQLRVREVPVLMTARAGGKSMHSGLKPLYYVAKMMVAISMVVLNRRRMKSYGH